MKDLRISLGLLDEVSSITDRDQVFVRRISTTDNGLIHIEFEKMWKKWWIELTPEEAIRIGFIDIQKLKKYYS